MNPITNMKNLNKMNDREIEMGLAGTKQSWHWEYKDSAWIFIGGLPYDLTEGDVVCVFSQYGEVVHVNLVRDLKTGKSRGFAFVCYQNQLSTILAVDNLNGMKLLGRLVRVDHVHTYKLPKDLEKMDEDRKKLFVEGCAPKPVKQAPPPDQGSSSESSEEEEAKKSKKSSKKKKKKEKKKKKKRKKGSCSDSDDGDRPQRREFKREPPEVKQEPPSPGSRRSGGYDPLAMIRERPKEGNGRVKEEPQSPTDSARRRSPQRHDHRRHRESDRSSQAVKQEPISPDARRRSEARRGSRSPQDRDRAKKQNRDHGRSRRSKSRSPTYDRRR